MISGANWEKIIPNGFVGNFHKILKTRDSAGFYRLKCPVIPYLGILFPSPHKKSKKKGKSPLENTEKAYIFVSFNWLPKILSIKNLVGPMTLRSRIYFNHKIGNMKFNLYAKNFIRFYFSLVQEK